jgi:hypothetical protein
MLPNGLLKFIRFITLLPTNDNQKWIYNISKYNNQHLEISSLLLLYLFKWCTF